MRKILMYLCISIWIVISCVPIILTSEYLTEASIMALIQVFDYQEKGWGLIK